MRTELEQLAIKETVDYVMDCLYTSKEVDVAKIDNMLLNMFKLHPLAEYACGDPLYTAENNENNAIIKAIQTKLKSIYNRELKRLKHERKNDQIAVGQKIVEKKAPPTRAKIVRKCVKAVHPDNVDNWEFGITKDCLDLCRVGLANFSTFASFFYYFKEDDLTTKSKPLVAKLKAREDGSGKDVVFAVI